MGWVMVKRCIKVKHHFDKKYINLRMATLIVHPKDKEQLTILKTFMKAFKISFEEEKSPYDPEFVKMIKQGEEDLKAGKGVKVDIDDLCK
jgi:hypothetical protein